MHGGVVMRIATWVIGVLLALGVRISILGPMMLLTVRGRSSGVDRTLPVDVHTLDGRRYLVATHGVGAWVLNLRAAGGGSLRLGRRREGFRARELAPAEAGPVIAATLGGLLARDGWRSRGVRANLGVGPGSQPEDYARAAIDHPVFEVLPTL
jgi:deazaflavin-dependent oxidoreductase (nitroreductase family)